MVGIAQLGTALTDEQAGLLRTALGPGSDRVVLATDNDMAGQRSAERGYYALADRGLDPRGAVLPAGLDPAKTVEIYGRAALVDALAAAEPMGRQLVDQKLAGHELTWVEDRVNAGRVAGAVISRAPSTTWEREVEAVAERLGLDANLVRSGVVDSISISISVDGDALGRLTARARRDDLDHGQHAPATAADIAALSTCRATTYRAKADGDDTISARSRVAVSAQRGRHL